MLISSEQNNLIMIASCLLLAINYIMHSQSIMGGRDIVLALQLHKQYVLPSCEGMELKIASVIQQQYDLGL